GETGNSRALLGRAHDPHHADGERVLVAGETGRIARSAHAAREEVPRAPVTAPLEARDETRLGSVFKRQRVLAQHLLDARRASFEVVEVLVALGDPELLGRAEAGVAAD